MDTVADMLTHVRNANQALKPNVVVRHSNLKENIARILKQEGYVSDYSVIGDAKKELQIVLKFKARKGVIAGITRVSKPGQPRAAADDGKPVGPGGVENARLGRDIAVHAAVPSQMVVSTPATVISWAVSQRNAGALRSTSVSCESTSRPGKSGCRPSISARMQPIDQRSMGGP